MGIAAGIHDVRRIGLWVLGLAVAALGLAICTKAWAGARDLAVSDFEITTYTEKDGVPVNTWVMAQTNDGWLWFGGPNGLYRFDGIRFEEVKIDSGDSNRSASISALYAPPSGELVIGKLRGGVSILKDGRLSNFNSEETRRAGRLNDLAQDADGFIWAAGANGLLRFDGETWQLIGKEWGFPSGETVAVTLDQHGTLWVGGANSVFSLEQGKRKFEATTIKGAWYFSQSPDGKTWVRNAHGPEMLPRQNSTTPRDVTASSRTSNGAWFDREGYFWDLDRKAGDGLPDPAVTGILSFDKLATTGLEDREGNIWIASARAAIYRLRRPAFTKVRSMTGTLGFVADKSGRVWMGSSGDLDRGDGGVWMFDTALHHIQPDEIKLVTAISGEPGGSIWLAGLEGLWRRRDARFKLTATLPEAARGQRVKGISADCAGGLWISVSPLGLLRYDGRNWRSSSDIPGLPEEMPTFQTCDSAGQLWLGYADGKVARVNEGETRIYGAAEGLQIGAVTAIGTGPLHTMVAGERGLAILQDGRFVMLEASDSRIFDRVTAIVETPDGDVWTNNSLGISRIEAIQISAQRLSMSDTPIAAELFDVSEGYPGPGFSAPELVPSATLGADGRIWLAGRDGIAWIDSSQAHRMPAKPPVVIQALSSGDQRFDRFDGVRLSKGTRNIQVDYTALNYSHPERLRFRYRLDGIDASWVAAYGRRQASYANLGPGNYRFVVNVTNEIGAWTDSSASVDFVIPPTFTQTLPFLGLCVAATLGILALLYQARVRQVRSRERQLVESRLKERERIARELHDTLLQGTQGLILKVHGAARLARSGQAVHDVLDEALVRADEVVAEGRDRIQGLRLAPKTGVDLVASFATVGEATGRGGSTRFDVVVEGSPRAMTSEALQEAYSIGREAIVNAFRHARPESVEVQLIFSNADFRLRVRDDGVGIDKKAFEGGSLPGHWGLLGMRERAQGIGAELQFWSRQGAGTEIELRIPAAVAYVRRTAGRRWWQFGSIVDEKHE